MRSRSRGELLENLRRRQAELQAGMEEEEEPEEEDKQSQVDHVGLTPLFVSHQSVTRLCFDDSPSQPFTSSLVQDSPEDEPSACNESVATEPSFVDENLVFNESKRVPFFKVSSKNINTLF